jgi:hypothetical protein
MACDMQLFYSGFFSLSQKLNKNSGGVKKQKMGDFRKSHVSRVFYNKNEHDWRTGKNSRPVVALSEHECHIAN